MCELTKKIKQVAEELPNGKVPPLTLADFKDIKEGITRYRLERGQHAYSRSLLDIPKASIALTTIPDEGVFPMHVHTIPVKYELIIILNGVLEMRIDGKSTKYKEFDNILIMQDVEHNAIAHGEVLLIAITIPKDYGFPKQSI